ncbi:MAG: OmpH family outer membrane protein [Phycisphaerae bacterium]
MRRIGLYVALVTAAAWLGPAGALGALEVGVVDLVEVTNNYERTKDASDDLQVEQANLKAETEPKVKEIEELRLKRDGFNRGTEEWEQINDQSIQKQLELRNWVAMQRFKIERRHRDVLLDMYRKITEVVSRLAKEKSLDLIFTQAFLEPPQIDVEESTGLEDLKKRIIGQRVLYPTDATDLTEEVLKILNAEYKAKGASGDKPKG